MIETRRIWDLVDCLFKNIPRECKKIFPENDIIYWFLFKIVLTILLNKIDAMKCVLL